MIEHFTRHRTAANLLMIGFLVLGVFALPKLKRATFPELPIDELLITVPYPGATPEDIEEAICQRIEDAIEGVEDIDEIRSEAIDSRATVRVLMQPGADPQIVFDDVRTEIEAIDDFPERIESPTLKLLGRVEDVASIAVTGDLSTAQLKAYCEELETRLQRLSEVELVEVEGFSDHQFRIEVSRAALLPLGLSPNDVAEAIAAQSIDLPAGTVETPQGNVVLRFQDERRSVEELENLVVVSDANGFELRLGNVAKVEDTFERDETKIVFDGRRAGLLRVQKTRSQDSLSIVEAVKTFVESENARLPGAVQLTLTQDRSSIVKDRLEMLVRNGWQGGVLVFLTLWLFLGMRLAFWVAMSLPVSFLGALFFMAQMGYSIDMLTMVALLLALGLLMDDGIVLAENIAAERAKGRAPLAAAIEGVRGVGVGVLSSFLTTVAIFAPLSFLEGDIGAILGVLPVVLILVLSVSLIEAFCILPNHLAHSLHGPAHVPGRLRRRIDAIVDGIREKVVGPVVDVLVRFRYLAFGTVIALFLSTVGVVASGAIKFQAFPEIDGDVIEARILLPPGTPLERTEQVVLDITNGLAEVNREYQPRQPNGEALVRHVAVRYDTNLDAFETGANVATVSVDLLPAESRDARLDDVLDLWRERVGAITDAVQVTYGEPSFGPAGRAIEIRLHGDDFDRLDRTSERVEAWFSQFDGVSDVFDDLRPGPPELRMRLRPGAAALGVEARGIASQLRTAFFGHEVSELQIGNESYEVFVRVSDEDRDRVADVEDLLVTLPDGRHVPLEDIVQIERGRGRSRIARIDQRRTVTVYGTVDPRRANVNQLLLTWQRDELPELQSEHPGLEVTFEGQAKNGAVTGKSMARGFLIGLIGIFLLLSFQFRTYLEPLVVMVAIPMCLIGVVWGHVAMGLDLTLPSMLGFASLAGVVVNDSILLVEFIKRERRAGRAVHGAACRASRLRFRAIILTSVTTVAGMTPLLVETSLQAQILIPLATSIVFGLLASTLLVLLIVPGLYVILADVGWVEQIEEELDTDEHGA